MNFCLDVYYMNPKFEDDIEKRIEWQNNFKKNYESIVKNYDGKIIVTDFYDGLAIIKWEYQIDDDLYRLANKISECFKNIIPNLIFNIFDKQKILSTLKDGDKFCQNHYICGDFEYTIYIREIV